MNGRFCLSVCPSVYMSVTLLPIYYTDVCQSQSIALQGWYIVTYALGIYILNLLIAFLSPKIDPALEDLDSNGESCADFKKRMIGMSRRVGWMREQIDGWNI